MAKKTVADLKPKTTRLLHFIVYGTAAPAGSKTAFVGKSGKAFVRDSSKGSYQWKDQVAKEAALAHGGRPLITEPLDVWLTFYVPRPKSHYGTGKNADVLKASAPKYPATKPDVLKLARAVEDALTSVVWRDDAQIVREYIIKAYGEPARVVIQVSRAV